MPGYLFCQNNLHLHNEISGQNLTSIYLLQILISIHLGIQNTNATASESKCCRCSSYKALFVGFCIFFF